MNASSRSGVPGRDELLAADRRVLALAASAVILLVLVGAVSSALFARPVCERIDPIPLTATERQARTLGTDLSGALGEAADHLADRFGPLTGAVEAAGSDALADTDGGTAVLGGEVLVLTSDGADVHTGAGFDDAAVVGDGGVLYALALVNELTGQVDALQPLGDGLEALTCVETAVVGSPLAFHLSAGDGELLLLRTDEDGSDAELQLRDPVRGQVWNAGLELPTAPAGVQGERVTAVLTGDVVVTARRASRAEEAPVVTAVDRDDGGTRWVLGTDDLDAVLGEVPRSAEVLGVRGGEVVVRFVDDADETDDAADADGGEAATSVVRIAVADGRVRGVGDTDTDLLGLRVRRGGIVDEVHEVLDPLADVALTDVVVGDDRLTVLLDVEETTVGLTFER